MIEILESRIEGKNRAPLSKLMCFLRALVSRYSVSNGPAVLFSLAKNKHDFFI